MCAVTPQWGVFLCQFNLKNTRVYCFERLLEEFENHIEELKQLDEKIQRRVEKLEHQCQREAKEFAHKVQDLYRSNQVCLMLHPKQNVCGVYLHPHTVLGWYNFTVLTEVLFVRWPFNIFKSLMIILAM